jgi:hypothetical protein
MAYHDERISYYRASRKASLDVYRFFCYFVCFYIFKTPGAVFCCFSPFLLFFGECIVQTSAAMNPACAGRSPLSTHLCRCLVLVPSSLGTRIRHSFPQQHHAHTSTDVIPSLCVDPYLASQSLQAVERSICLFDPCPSPPSTQSTYSLLSPQSEKLDQTHKTVLSCPLFSCPNLTPLPPDIHHCPPAPSVMRPTYLCHI